MKIDRETIIDIDSFIPIKKQSRGNSLREECDVSINYPKHGNKINLSISLSKDVYSIMGSPIGIEPRYKDGKLLLIPTKDGFKVSKPQRGAKRYYIRTSLTSTPVKAGHYELYYLENQNVYYVPCKK